MKKLTFLEISAMKGNGSSVRTVLKCFIDMGADIYLIYELPEKPIDRYFLVKYDGLTIPLRAYKLNFYCVFNSALSYVITSDKLRSQAVLEAWNIPVPKMIKYRNSEAGSFLAEYAPIVVKPRRGAHGDGITVDVKKIETMNWAVLLASKFSNDVLLQQYVHGEDYRLLFVNYKFIAAVKRTPASVVGNGKSSILELVEASNADKSMIWKQVYGAAAEAAQVRGSISKTPVEEIVAARGEAFLSFVPAKGENVKLLDKANVSLGGQTMDVTDEVNNDLVRGIEIMLRALGLTLCGVDVLSTDITSRPEDDKSFVIELNSAPGLRLHELPLQGESRPVCQYIADSLIEYYRNSA